LRKAIEFIEQVRHQNRTFTTADDKQDLLKAITSKHEWMKFEPFSK
jgi:hypothetical protein